MPNQRTLLIIKRDSLHLGGDAECVQSSEPSLNLSRIHWEWVVLTRRRSRSPTRRSKDAALIDSTNGAVHDDGEVNGAPPLPKQDVSGQAIPVVTA